MSERLAYMSYALRDGDVKEAELVYKEIANSATYAAEPDLRLDIDPLDER